MVALDIFESVLEDSRCWSTPDVLAFVGANKLNYTSMNSIY